MQFAVIFLVLLQFQRTTAFECKNQTNKIMAIDDPSLPRIGVVGKFSTGSTINCTLGCLTVMAEDDDIAYIVKSGCANDLDFELQSDQCVFRQDGFYCLSYDRNKSCPHYTTTIASQSNNDPLNNSNQTQICISGCEVKLAPLILSNQDGKRSKMESMKITVNAGCKTVSIPQRDCTIQGDSALCPYNLNGNNNGPEFVKMYAGTFRPFTHLKNSESFTCDDFKAIVSYEEREWKLAHIRKFESRVCPGACQAVASNNNGRWTFEAGCAFFSAVRPNSIVRVLRNGVIFHIWTCDESNCTTYKNGTFRQRDETELLWFLEKFGIRELTP